MSPSRAATRSTLTTCQSTGGSIARRDGEEGSDRPATSPLLPPAAAAVPVVVVSTAEEYDPFSAAPVGVAEDAALPLLSLPTTADVPVVAVVIQENAA